MAEHSPWIRLYFKTDAPLRVEKDGQDKWLYLKNLYLFYCGGFTASKFNEEEKSVLFAQGYDVFIRPQDDGQLYIIAIGEELAGLVFHQEAHILIAIPKKYVDRVVDNYLDEVLYKNE